MMLEGIDGELGFFVTIRVVCLNEEKAEGVAFEEATHRGLNILSVEEVSLVSQSWPAGSSQVVEVSGLSYFN